MQYKARIAQNRIEVKPHLTLGSEMKAIGGRWDKKSGAWVFPRTRSYLHELIRLYGQNQLKLSSRTQDLFVDQHQEITRRQWDRLPETIQEEIDTHQLEAIRWMLGSHHRGHLLAHSPGLGKTLTSIAYALLKGYRKVLIVCPFSLIDVWVGQCRLWDAPMPEIAHGQRPEGGGWVVTNYETIASEYTFTKHGRVESRRGWFVDYDLIIFDESIFVKSRDSLRMECAHVLAKEQAKQVLLLSGVPITRYADDLWAQFRVIDDTLYPSYWRFARTYCVTEETQWGTQVLGTRSGIDLRQEFGDLMHVKNIDEVLDLPEYQYHRVPCDLGPNQTEMYRKAHKAFMLILSEEEEVPISTRFAQMTRLMQIVSYTGNITGEWSESGKIDALTSMVQEGKIQLPLLVWTYWRATADYVHDRLSEHINCAKVYGDTKARNALIKDFQQGRLQCLVLSLGVGKYGFTLTNTRSIAYVDRTFDADAFMQSLPRVRRRGLTHQPDVYTFVAPKTIDQYVEANLAGKMPGISQLTNADLATLLKGLKGE